MKLLCWDTSSKDGTIAALEWDPSQKSGWAGVRLVAEWNLSVDLTQSERLLWGIDLVLKSARWKIKDIDLFGVGIGPGSFTGLRVGVTTARTLAHTLGKPLIGVSSLAALARPASLWLCSQKSRVVVVASTDAAKGELFALWGIVRSVADCVVLGEGDQPGLWKRGVEEKVIDPEDLMRALKVKLGEGGKKGLWVAVGEGRHRYPEIWKKLPASRELKISVPFMNQVQARYVGMLAWEAFQAGRIRTALQVFPRYARVADAEKKLKAGLLPPGPTRGTPGDC